MPEWTRTSASQYDGFQRCNRYWYFKWIDKLPVPDSPARAHGKNIHKEAEHYLLTGEIRDSDYGGLNFRPYVEALVPHLPPPMHDELIVEQEVNLEVIPGVWWKGYIDHGLDLGMLSLGDIKTTSNLRYAKTPAELMKNIQLMSYARWVYEVLRHLGEIDLRHVYVQTSKQRVPKQPKTKVVNIVTDAAHVGKVWDGVKRGTEEMQLAAQCSSAHELPPNTDSCRLYPPEGCPFKKQCGLSIGDFFAINMAKSKSKGTDMSSFLAKLKAKKQGTTEAGILPPDAPSRETEVEEDEETEVEEKPKTKKVIKKKVIKKKVTAKKTTAPTEESDGETEEKSRPKASGNGAAGSFVIYIDCMPVKDLEANGVEPTLFEDWFAGLAQKMNDEVEEKENLPSYMLLPYSEEKVMVTLTVKEHLDRLPPTLVVNSSTLGAKDALGLLIPHASKVVRAVRG